MKLYANNNLTEMSRPGLMRINCSETLKGMDFFCGSFMFFSVLCLLCTCARLFIHVSALWSPAGKGLTSWLSFVVSLSHWYPGSGVVLDCIVS